MTKNQSDTKILNNMSVLISGGSGFIGMNLTSLLLSKGYKVSHLSRKANQFGKVRVYRWDPEKEIINPEIFEGIDCIIHLSGANIGEKHWTKSRKEEIIKSRAGTAKFLYKVISQNGIHIRTFISASATGFYGSISSDKIFREEDKPASDFLGTTCRLWEEAADLFANAGVRTAKVRSGVVLDKNDNALARLLEPAKFGLFPRLGSGNQYMSWISLPDLCNIYLKILGDDNMDGVYNAVMPQYITQIEFMRTLAQKMHKPFFHPPLPEFALKTFLGKMSDIVLKGSRVSSEKIINSGFDFEHPTIDDALSATL
jgi:uncharacterized protein (TIGR01777 family)